MVNTADALNNQNVQAFLATIRAFESRGGDYAILYGGGHFTSFDAHPNIRIPFNNPKRAPHADGTPNDYSTAAGAYQITHPTWLMVRPLISASDFGPAAQDQAAIQLLKMCGALSLIIAGDFSGAIAKASGTWASLPASTSGQRKVTIAQAFNTYQQNGGTALA